MFATALPEAPAASRSGASRSAASRSAASAAAAAAALPAALPAALVAALAAAFAVALAAAFAACSSAPVEPLAQRLAGDAGARWRAGNLEAAREGYERALREDLVGADPAAAAQRLNNLSVLALYRGDLAEARALVDEALALAALLDDGAIESDYLAGGERGDAGAGNGTTRSGEASAQSAATRQAAALLRGRLELQRACIALRAGQLSEARAALEALSSWASAASAADRAHLALLQAGLALRQGRVDDARAAAETARSLSSADEDHAAAHLIEGKAAAMPSEARRAFAAGVAAARRAGHLPLLVECLLGMARAHAPGDPATAERYAQLALRAAQARRFTPGVTQAEAVLQELRAAQR